MLEERCDDERRILELLRSSHRTDAVRILESLRAGDDAHSLVDFALDLTSARIANDTSTSGALAPDQISADGVTFPILDDTLPTNASGYPFLPETNTEDSDRMRRREKIHVPDAGEISLPSFQTLV